jgi:hypothetical protein
MGLSANYSFVKDFCRKYKLDVIEVFGAVKELVRELSQK